MAAGARRPQHRLWDYIPSYIGFSGTIAIAWGDRWTGEQFPFARKNRWRFYIDSDLIETEFAKILERFADPTAEPHISVLTIHPPQPYGCDGAARRETLWQH